MGGNRHRERKQRGKRLRRLGSGEKMALARTQSLHIRGGGMQKALFLGCAVKWLSGATVLEREMPPSFLPYSPVQTFFESGGLR